MDNSYQRTDRIADVLRREIADVLSREVKDPRLQFVTITHVRVTRDLRNARVFFSTLKEGEELEAIRQGLKKASGFVQRKVGSRIHMRYTPHITFEHDELFEHGSRMDRILKDVEEELEKDEE